MCSRIGRPGAMENAGFEDDEPNSRAGKTTRPDKKPSYRDGFLSGPVVFPVLLFVTSFSSPAFSVVEDETER